MLVPSNLFYALIENTEFSYITSMVKALQESAASSVDSVKVANPDNEQLWVEKYAPKSFTELLSDEQTNREVCCDDVICHITYSELLLWHPYLFLTLNNIFSNV